MEAKSTGFKTSEGKSSIWGSLLAIALPIIAQLTGLPEETLRQVLDIAPWAIGLIGLFAVARLAYKAFIQKQNVQLEIEKIKAGLVKPEGA